jgi:hypothetical protein
MAALIELLKNATTTGAGTRASNPKGLKTYQAWGTTSAGAGAATVLIRGSNDDTNWDTIGTLALTLATTTSSDSFTSQDCYEFIRAEVSAISGTGAVVSAAEAS